MKSISKVNLGGNFIVELDKVLGKGATGCVYEGKDLRNEGIVAVKVIKLETIDNEVTEYLLKMQKNALIMLNSAYVVKGLGNWQNESECFMVTEYCNGKTLKDYIKYHQKLSFERSIEIFKGILQGYKNLVENGVVHRDMKPANIMLHNNMPKIIDFGYCQIIGYKKPSLEYNVGSPSYMSPQSYKLNIYNQKTQIWAIGVIFYECLTGKTIDEGKEMKDTFREIKIKGVPYPAFVNAQSRKIIDWCLNQNPKLRPTCCEILEQIDKLSKNGVKRKVMNKLSINHQPVKFESQWNPQTARVNQKQTICFSNGRNSCYSQYEGKVQKTERKTVRQIKERFPIKRMEKCVGLEQLKEKDYQLTDRKQKIISISRF